MMEGRLLTHTPPHLHTHTHTHIVSTLVEMKFAFRISHFYLSQMKLNEMQNAATLN